jgi:trehalose-6-phosphate synthase
MFAKLDALSGRINGAHAEMDWIPIRNVHRLHSREELAGIYRAADVALVTPLRDGMNLVAKEFVAAQDEADPGVLVLSRFAGAAAQMKDALIVNPFSQEDVADAIKKALAMPLAERRRNAGVRSWTASKRTTSSPGGTISSPPYARPAPRAPNGPGRALRRRAGKAKRASLAGPPSRAGRSVAQSG